MTITEAVEAVIRGFGSPLTIEEIYDKILEKQLFEFNTDNPMHVLKTQIERHIENSKRTDVMTEVKFFRSKEKIGVIEMRKEGMRRIHRAVDKEEIIEMLTNSSNGFFVEKWRLLLFAACIGFHTGVRESLSAVDSGKGIDQSTFGNSGCWPGILYLMGIVTSSEDILSALMESERIQVFEEYANGGLSIIKEKLGSVGDVSSFITFINGLGAEQSDRPSLDLDLTI